MTESDLKKEYYEILEPYFHIDPEVNGTHFSGKKFSIDCVVTPREKESWKNPNVAFGIEFKDVDRFRQNFDTKNYTKWLAQCIDYSNTNWDKYGYLYIFTCPGIIDDVPSQVLGNEQFVLNFMGQMGIGELKKLYRYGLSFSVHAKPHRIWSELKGVEEGKQWTLKRKFGSR